MRVGETTSKTTKTPGRGSTAAARGSRGAPKGDIARVGVSSGAIASARPTLPPGARRLAWALVAFVALLWAAPALLAALGDRERFLALDLVDVSLPYVVIGAFVTFDAVIPILPSESVLTTASTLAAQPGNDLELGLVLLAGAAGAVAGDSLLYWISRTLGRRLIQDRLDRALDDPRIAPAWAVFGDSAPLLVIGGRFVPGLRFVVNATMGLRPYPYPRFLALSAAGSLLWATFTCVLSFQIGERLSGKPLLSILASVVVSGGIVLGMVLVLRRRYLRERAAAGEGAGEGPAAAGGRRGALPG